MRWIANVRVSTNPGYIFLNSGKCLHSDPVYLRASYFLVLADIYQAGMLTPKFIVILFTRGLFSTVH